MGFIIKNSLPVPGIFTKINRIMNQLPDFLLNPNPEIYLGDNYVVLDFETTNKDRGSAINRDNRLVLSTWVLGKTHSEYNNSKANMGRIRDNGVYFEFGERSESLLEAISTASFVVCQNGKFEYQWLIRLGVDVSRILLYDTLLSDYVEAGNRRRPKDLNSIAKREKILTKDSLVSELIKGGVCPSDIPEDWLLEYGALDTLITRDVFIKQRQRLSAAGLLPVLFTRCIATPVLAEMEMTGLQLDQEKVEERYGEVASEFAGYQEELSGITGGINLNSPKQVGAYLYDNLGFEELTGRDGKPDRTDAGGRRTDADTIGTLRPKTEAQRVFAELYRKYRKIAKLFETLEKMHECCNNDGGHLFASYNQAVTQTHRLSSSGSKYKLQFHNFDRRNKPLFKARTPGWRVGEADGAQLEFRVAAHLGRDEVAGADIRNPEFDAHYQTTALLLGKSREHTTKDERSNAKPFTFKPLYGGMSGTPEQKKYYKFFQEKYSGIYSTQKRWTLEVLRSGRLATESGMVFYWPGTKISRTGYIDNTTSIFNYPVQSFATAEIIPISLVYFWHRAKSLNLKMFLVNTVHDSIIAELPPEEEEVFNEISKVAFTEDVFRYLNSVYGVEFTVPLGCETKIGPNWGKGKEWKYDLDPITFFGKE